MKKKITHPDGRVEEVEGSAQEIAEYEKTVSRVQKKESKTPTRKILNEEIARLTKEVNDLKNALLQPVIPWDRGTMPDRLPYPYTLPVGWYTITSDKIVIDSDGFPVKS